MTEQDAFVTHVLTLLTPLGDVRQRRMFGGYGLFLDGCMFALVSRNGGLFLKADDVNRRDFEARGCRSHGKMPYFEAPPECLDGWQGMEPFAMGAVAAAQRAKANKPPKRSKKI